MAILRKVRVAAAVVVLASAGLAIASPMAFKFIPDLALGDPLIYDVSIPSENGLTDLSGVSDAITAACPGGAAQVTVFDTDQTSCSYTGEFSCNRTLLPGEAVRVSVNAPCTGWIIVGTEGGGGPGSPSRTFSEADPSVYQTSIPLHTIALTAAQLCNEIPNCAMVTRFNPDQTSASWTGQLGVNFPIVPGQAYHVSVTAPTVWYPSHY